MIEKINFTVTTNGVVSRSEIEGVVRANTKLTGMPIVELGLNEKDLEDDDSGGLNSFFIEFNDVKFHRCVDLKKYN